MVKDFSRDLPDHMRLAYFRAGENPALLAAVQALRYQVWTETGTRVVVPDRDFAIRDPADEAGLHLAIVQSSSPSMQPIGSVIAAVRLDQYQRFVDKPGSQYFDESRGLPAEPVAVVSRLVVATSFQRAGLGSFLDRTALEIAKSAGCRSIICDVPPYRLDSLHRAGFRVMQAPRKGVVFPDIDWTVLCLDVESPNVAASSTCSVKEALIWIVAQLEEHGIPFQIVGGLAARVYGAVRPIVDIDMYIPEHCSVSFAKHLEDFITKPLKHYREDLWDITYFQIVYRGRKLEFGVSPAKILDKRTGEWVDQTINFSASQLREFDGVRIPVMPRAELIAYKRLLDREVDRLDLAQIDRQRS